MNSHKTTVSLHDSPSWFWLGVFLAPASEQDPPFLACSHRRPDLLSSVAAKPSRLPSWLLDQHVIAQSHVPLPLAWVDFGTEVRKADRVGNDAWKLQWLHTWVKMSCSFFFLQTCVDRFQMVPFLPDITRPYGIQAAVLTPCVNPA